MAALTVQGAGRSSSGTAMTAQTISGTSGTPDTFENDGYTVLLIYNADVSTATTVTVKSQARVDGLALADAAVSVPASTTANPVAFGPFDPQVYGSTAEVWTSDTSDTTAYVLSYLKG